jgi:hypothetical protein
LTRKEAARRAAAAKADRNIAFRPIEDSQALLIAKGSALQIRALDLQLDADARALIADGDPRTMDQLRFDLLCAHRSDAVNAKPLQALIHVPVATALGISDEPGTSTATGRSQRRWSGTCSPTPSSARSASTRIPVGWSAPNGGWSRRRETPTHYDGPC